MAETLRLDKYLWYARLAKTRTLAQAVAEGGHLRIDGRVVDRAHCPVRVSQVLSFPLHGRVRVIRVVAIPDRRGPAPEAQACYEEVVEALASPAPFVPSEVEGRAPELKGGVSTSLDTNGRRVD